MEDLSHKSKDELISEIKQLKEKLDSTGIYFPGLGVINKYEQKAGHAIDKYRLLFMNASDAIFVIKKNSITECNERAEQLFAAIKEQIIGKPIWDMMPMTQPDGSNSRERFHQYIKSSNRSSVLLQVKMHKKSGENFDAEISVNEFKVGYDTYLQTIVRDVSERISLAKQLKDEYDKRIEEQDITQSGNWEFNADNFDVYWSPSTFAIHELPKRKGAPNFNKYVEQFVHPDDKEKLFGSIQNSIRIGGNFDMDYKIVTQRKNTKYLHVIGKAIYNLEGEVKKIVGTVVDITDRKALELQLLESKITYKSLVQSLPEGVVIYNLSEILYANESAYGLADINAKTNSNKYNIFNFVLPKFKPEITRKINHILSGKNYGAIEMKMVKSNGEVIDIEARSVSIIYKGKPAIQAIFNDISYRKKVEKSLRESERQLSTLISNLQGMAYRCKNDKNWSMEFVSSGCFNLTGYSSEAIISGKPHYNDLIVEEDRDRVWQEVQQALEKKQSFNLSYRICNSKNEIIWISEKGKGVFDESDQLLALEGFMADNSKQKFAEIELQESHHNYKNLVDFVPEGIVIHKHGEIVFLNQKALKVFGFDSIDQIKGKSVMDYLLPQYREAVNRRIDQANSGIEQPFYEIEIRTADNKVVQVETRSIPFVYQGEKCILVAIHLVGAQKLLQREIIRAKMAEEANEVLKIEIEQKEKIQRELLKSQIYTKNIINSSLDMIIANDDKRNITEFNKAAQIIFGYSANEVLGKPISILYATEKEFSTVHGKMQKEGVFSGEIVNKRKNGELFESFITATGLYDDNGEIIGSMGVSRDLSKSKQEKQRLHLSEERYKAIYNQVFVGIARVDLNGNYLQVNQRFCDILGYSDKELLKLNVSDVLFKEGIAQKKELLLDLQKNKIANYTEEVIYKNKKGNSIQANVNISLVLNERQEPAYFVMVCEDISEAKTNQELFVKQTAKLNSIIENSNYLVMAVDKNMQLSTFNSNALQWFKTHYNVDAKLGMSVNKAPLVSSSKTNTFWHKKILEAFEGKPQSFEFLTTNLNNIEALYEFFINPIFGPNNKVIEVSIIAYDITEKKKTEEKIINQSAKLNAIIENSSHQIYTVDSNFILQSFNELYAKTVFKDFGRIPYIGIDLKQNAKEAMPANHYKNFISMHKDALNGSKLQFETKFIDRKNQVVYYQVYLDPIVLPDGKVNEVSYIAHDITDRKLAEKKIIESLKEKEVLLKEVHHRVKNNLQVISSILNLQRAYLKDKSSDSIFRELQNRVRSMSFIHESLYQTQDFSNLDFNVYLENLTTNVKHSYLIDDDNIELEMHCDPIFLNLDYSIPCGLIVNELVSNAFKYAFPDSRVGKIEVIVKKKLNFVHIIVRDNGIGISNTIDITNTESLGLQLVNSLVEQLDGVLVHTRLKEGTEMEIKFKLNK